MTLAHRDGSTFQQRRGVLHSAPPPGGQVSFPLNARIVKALMSIPVE